MDPATAMAIALALFEGGILIAEHWLVPEHPPIPAKEAETQVVQAQIINQTPYDLRPTEGLNWPVYGHWADAPQRAKGLASTISSPIYHELAKHYEGVDPFNVTSVRRRAVTAANPLLQPGVVTAGHDIVRIKHKGKISAAYTFYDLTLPGDKEPRLEEDLQIMLYMEAQDTGDYKAGACIITEDEIGSSELYSYMWGQRSLLGKAEWFYKHGREEADGYFKAANERPGWLFSKHCQPKKIGALSYGQTMTAKRGPIKIRWTAGEKVTFEVTHNKESKR